MLIKTETIILSTLKYNDTNVIVKTFTSEVGFATYFIKGLLKSKKGKLKKAYFQPGALLEIVASKRENEQMEYIREAVPVYHYENIQNDFDKLSIATFLREILIQVLSNEQTNKELFNFIKNSFISLDKEKFNPDFHIIFLLQLTKHLGFYPDVQSKGKYFDLINGCFTHNTNQSIHFIDENETIIFHKYLGMVFAYKNKAKMSNFQRKIMLNLLMKYYEIQLVAFKNPKSLEILNELYKNL